MRARNTPEQQAAARERRKKRAREKYWKNVEESRARQREVVRKYAESRKPYRKEYVAKNRERIRAANIAYLRMYSRKNRKILSKKQRESYQTNIQVRLRMNLRTRLGLAIRKNRAGSAVRDLGCSISDLCKHLESSFVLGMSWDNYGEWHIDHIVPLSWFDLTNRDQFLSACHFSNLQPLWASDNLKKSNTSIDCNNRAINVS